MKKTLALALCLCLLPLALAAPIDDATYISVVGDEAPASDVVSAANFASAMKQAVGVDFTGATESMLSSLSESELDERLIVSIDGDEAEIVSGVLAGTSFSEVTSVATTYLEGEGFTVTRSTTASVATTSAEPEVTTTTEPEAVTLEEVDEVFDEECPLPMMRCDGVCVDVDYDPQNCGGCGVTCIDDDSCLDGICEPPPCSVLCTSDEECPKDFECVTEGCDATCEMKPKRTVIKAIWDWFAGLFS